MNNRQTLSDIAELLAERGGKDNAATEQFLREFVAVISEGLFADKIVKINGLGTFKLVLVEKRESINVNTGERFIIPAHYKYSFLPDKELKEIVNKPFSLFETTEINENVSFEGMEEESGEEVNPEEESVEEDIPEAILITEPVSDSLPIQPEVPIQPSTRLNEPIDKPLNKVINKPASKPKIPFYKRESVVASVVLFAFIAVSVLIYKIYGEKPSKPVTKKPFRLEVAQSEEIISEELAKFVEPMGSTTDSVAAVDTLAVEIPVKKAVIKEEEEVSQPKPKPATVIGKIKIETGDRLTLIALKYYGHKIFWVYLYQANKNLIKNPNSVPIGTVITIPPPSRYDIDAKSSTSIAKAAALQSEILSAYP